MSDLENFAQLFARLGRMPDQVYRGMATAVKRAGVRVMGTAKAKISHYQKASGPYPAWPKLKPSTVEKKLRRKYTIKNGPRAGQLLAAGRRHLAAYGTWATGTDADAPLKDMGHLHGSITMKMQDDLTAVVGSNEKYAAIHEFGGMAGRGRQVPIPARPYLRPALYENKEAIKREFVAAIRQALGGK